VTDNITQRIVGQRPESGIAPLIPKRGIEHGLVQQARLDDPVRGAQQHDGRMAELPAPRDFPDQQRAAAIQRNKQHKRRGKMLDRAAPQQKLSHPGGQKHQSDRRRQTPMTASCHASHRFPFNSILPSS
jgi:hypothetical protein